MTAHSSTSSAELETPEFTELHWSRLHQTDRGVGWFLGVLLGGLFLVLLVLMAYVAWWTYACMVGPGTPVDVPLG